MIYSEYGSVENALLPQNLRLSCPAIDFWGTFAMAAMSVHAFAADPVGRLDPETKAARCGGGALRETTSRSLTDEERQLVNDLIVWLASNGKLDEAERLQWLLNNGYIQVDAGRTDDVAAQWRWGTLYLNETILQLTPWSPRGKANTNLIVQAEQFEERMLIVSILYHEWVHDNNGEHGALGEGADEKRAYAAEKAYLVYILNNKQLTSDQKARIMNRIKAIDYIVTKDYGGW